MLKRFLLFLSVATALFPPAYAAGQERYRIALVEQAGREGVTAALKVAFEEKGFICETLTVGDLADSNTFTYEKFNCLCLSDAREYPDESRPVLEAYFKAGGDAVLLGGYAFKKPLWFYRSQWRDAAQMQAALADDLHDRRTLVDLQTVEADLWKHGKNREQSRSTVMAAPGADNGPGLLIDIKGIAPGDWDTFQHRVADVPDEHNAIGFYAKASAHTRELVIEINEDDHSRWIYVQPLTEQWRHYAILDRQFRFFGDGSPRSRGQAGDQLNLRDARSISFGMAWGFSAFETGDHQIYLCGVESAYAEVPANYARAGQVLELPIYDAADDYELRGVKEIKTYEKAELAAAYQRSGTFSGVSAVGFAYPNQSAYLPLLGAYDTYGRRVGFAAGALVHYDGPYRGGRWLIAGIEEAEFYAKPAAAEYVAQILMQLVDPQVRKKLRQHNETSKTQRLALTSPAGQAITIRADGRHLQRPDGRKFFILGSNYLGSFDRKCYHGNDGFDVEYLERDFRKAQEAGINCLRFWNFSVEREALKMQTVLELARRYQIYLILHPTAHPKPSDKELMELFETNAKLVAEEPMVIGYDLMNEPLITMVGSISYKGGASAILRHRAYENYSEEYFDKKWVDRLAENRAGWPELGEWIKGMDAKNLYAAHFMACRYMDRRVASRDASSLVGIEKLLPYPAEYAALFAAVDETFADWIALHREAIGAYDKRHYVTVGYHSPLTALAANRQLDFISHHLYQAPGSFEDFKKAVTTFDRLRKLFTDKPITLGEFGYSSGCKMASGRNLDSQSAAVAEMILYLYAFAHDYSGAMNWMVSEWPVPNMAYNGEWIAPEDGRMQSGFGLYYYDGTLTGKAKPIAAATRFFRRYLDAHEPGQGVMELQPQANPIQTSYVYRNEDALFVGGRQFRDEHMAYEHSGAVNVMLSWNDGGLSIMAGDDVTIELYPGAWEHAEAAFADKPQGIYRSYEKSAGAIQLGLLAGEIVELAFSVQERL